MTSSNAAVGSETILLISTDIETRILIRKALSDRGYLVVQAPNEQDAAYICKLLDGKIDLIIADAVAPRVGSRSDWGLLVPPILVLVDSAAVSGDTREMATGPKYLARPLTEEKIAVEVRAMLDSQE
jgi:DNA-binding response OmpR family regulator